MTLLDTVKMKDEIKMKFLKRVDEMYNKIGCLQEIDPGFKNIAEKFELGRKYIAKVENESKDEVLIIPQNKVLEAENLLKKEKHHISDDVGSSVVHGINLDNKKSKLREIINFLIPIKVRRGVPLENTPQGFRYSKLYFGKAEQFQYQTR